MDIDEISSFLVENLNIYSGIVQESTFSDDDKYYQKVIDIRWRGDIHFIFYYNLNGHGYYSVVRDMQRISSFYWVTKFKEKELDYMQQLINDIESGRYNKKKTLKESIREEVEKRGLTSYMNATKWKELIEELKKYPDISFMYKSLFDEQSPKYYWGINDDEDIDYMNRAVIEWMRIDPRVVEIEYIGRLIEPNITETDLSLEVEGFLKKHSISYEYDEVEKIYTIFGWK